MFALVGVCGLSTLVVLLYIFRPLMTGGRGAGFLEMDTMKTSLQKLLRKKETVYENIKDLEFEFKMGKLSEDDYQRLRSELSKEAYEVMSRIDSIQPEVLKKTGQPQVVAVLKSGENSN
jgi:hypothetical protein